MPQSETEQGPDVPGTLVLVTFCNTVASPVCSFALVDTATHHVRRLGFDYQRQSDHGATGLAELHDGSYALALPGSRRLLRLSETLEPLGSYRDQAFDDLHSLAYCGDTLYATSTGRDCVLEVQVFEDRFEPRTAHNLTEQMKDTLHVNSVCFYKGEMIASIFGIDWRAQGVGAPVGAVIALETGEPIWTGFRHPHTLTYEEGVLYILDSYSGQVERLDDNGGRTVAAKFDGYLRGLSFHGDGYAVVGLSARRLRSRGLGTANEDSGGPTSRRTGLLVYSPDWELLDVIDLSWFGPEVYDITPCPAGIPAPTIEDTLEASKTRSEQLALTWQIPDGGPVPPPPSGRGWEPIRP